MTSSPVQLSRRQGYGCLAIAAVGLIGAALCLVLGIRCMASDTLFDCIGLLTVFPAGFAAVGLVALAVGVRRFTNADRAAAALQIREDFQRFGVQARNGTAHGGNSVIELPGRSDGNGFEGNREGTDEDR